MEQAAAQAHLTAVFSARTPSGAAVFTGEQCAHAFAFLLVAGADALKGRTLPPPLADLLGRVGVALGVTPSVVGEPLAQALAQYFRLYPVHPSLLVQLESAVGKDWGAAALALCALAETPVFPSWLPVTATPGQGRVAAGPLARNALSTRKRR